MSVSQKDIAQKLDLSVATISRCLSNDSRIPPKTRVKVIAMAHKMGYQPKKVQPLRPSSNYFSARAATLEQPTALSVFVQDSATHGSSNTLQAIAGMSAAAQDLNASLALQFFSPDKAKAIHLPQNQPDQMRNGFIQGVILLCHFDHNCVTKLAEQVPCIVTQHPTSDHIDYVGSNNIAVTKTMVKKLSRLGHKKIGFVDGREIAPAYKQRLEGFILGKYEENLEQDRELIFPTWNYMIDKETPDFSELHRWIKQGVSAIVCANDDLAIRLYRWLTHNNYHCPEQVSITGVDGEPMPPGIPQISTMNISFYNIGCLAVKHMITRIKEPDLNPVQITVKADFIEGNTMAEYKGQ